MAAWTSFHKHQITEVHRQVSSHANVCVLSTCCSAAVGVQCDSVDCSRSRAALRRVWVYSARRCSTAGCTWPVFAVLQCCRLCVNTATDRGAAAAGRCKNNQHSGWSQSSPDDAQHRGEGRCGEAGGAYSLVVSILIHFGALQFLLLWDITCYATNMSIEYFIQLYYCIYNWSH